MLLLQRPVISSQYPRIEVCVRLETGEVRLMPKPHDLIARDRWDGLRILVRVRDDRRISTRLRLHDLGHDGRRTGNAMRQLTHRVIVGRVLTVEMVVYYVVHDQWQVLG